MRRAHEAYSNHKDDESEDFTCELCTPYSQDSRLNINT